MALSAGAAHAVLILAFPFTSNLLSLTVQTLCGPDDAGYGCGNRALVLLLLILVTGGLAAVVTLWLVLRLTRGPSPALTTVLTMGELMVLPSAFGWLVDALPGGTRVAIRWQLWITSSGSSLTPLAMIVGVLTAGATAGAVTIVRGGWRGLGRFAGVLAGLAAATAVGVVVLGDRPVGGGEAARLQEAVGQPYELADPPAPRGWPGSTTGNCTWSTGRRTSRRRP
ncbi:MAG TPA: hypothetical protein VI248_05560 [Kineosporiaceae bacterium]